MPVEIGKVARLEKRAKYLHSEYINCTNEKERAVLKRKWKQAKRAVEYEHEIRGI